MDISMKSRKAGMEEGIMPIKYFQAGWRRETFQTLSYVKLFMATMKMKNNFCDGYQNGVQKSCDGGGNNAYKIFTNLVEEGYIPNTISYVELFMNTLKIKNNFCIGHQYEMQKSRDGEGNNACKIIMCRVEERNVICKHKTCLELFTATMKKKQLSELSKVNSMKPKSQDRSGDSVKRTKKPAKTSTVKRCLSKTKDQALEY